jgi:hypothetical protein
LNWHFSGMGATARPVDDHSISGYISGNEEVGVMRTSRESPVAKHRRRLKRKGLVRVELQLRKSDVALVRRVATALLDPGQEAEARALLHARFAERSARGLKALLAAAPLEGIEIERSRDTGRPVEL